MGARKSRRIIAAIVVGSTITVVPAASAAPVVTVATATKYKNCTELNRKYKHGVAKSGAKDKVKGKGKPVKGFTVNNAVYKTHRRLDRDGDGIACEK